MLTLATASGCGRAPGDTPSSGASAAATPSARAIAAPSAVSPEKPASAAASSGGAGGPAAPASPTLHCPEGMALVNGGEFWMGSDPKEHFSDDESPRFLTRLAPFCMDVTEVTVAAWATCVERGACKKTTSHRFNCNESHEERSQHPINCVTFYQAEAFCAAQHARLPTEVEWEFAARGGAEYRRYPWGDGSPDGRACWKHPGTCPVKSFDAGAFGLFDVSGNVWEWTATWYGAYPFPPEQGFSKVYRGGSFSRRFEKWMHTRLRNRVRPDDFGSHLGFRCALTPEGATCPFGSNPDGSCQHGVVSRSCPSELEWNGVRCAAPGAPRCRPGWVEKAGFGCVVEGEQAPAMRDLDAESKGIRRERSPEFDADCRANQRDRSHAFRYLGGTHEARNLVSRRDGCKNRDVGVGWNSTCCP